MNIYNFLADTKEFSGVSVARIDPKARTYMLPANATFTSIPDTTLDNEHKWVWDVTNNVWQAVIDYRGKSYYDADGTEHVITALNTDKPENCTWEKPVITPVLTLKDYENAVQNHIDTVAQENDFDNILTCTKYSGFDNEFRTHAESLLTWNANCWIKCHSIMDEVSAGKRTSPTIDEVIAELPTYTKP